MMESGTKPRPLCGYFKIKKVGKIKKYRVEVLVTKVEELKDIEDFDAECKSCKRPILTYLWV